MIMSREMEVIKYNTLGFAHSQLIARDPFGPLTNSLCAMAALHNKQVRVAQGLDQPDNTTANQFFDRAYWQLVNTSARASSIHSTSDGTSQAAPGYSEADALAAIHLVGFFLLKDGSGDWSAHLDSAREWLLQTGLCTEGNHNPKATLATMSDAEQLAVKMVIVSSLNPILTGALLSVPVDRCILVPYVLTFDLNSGMTSLRPYRSIRALVSCLCAAVCSAAGVTSPNRMHQSLWTS